LLPNKYWNYVWTTPCFCCSYDWWNSYRKRSNQYRWSLYQWKRIHRTQSESFAYYSRGNRKRTQRRWYSFSKNTVATRWLLASQYSCWCTLETPCIPWRTHLSPMIFFPTRVRTPQTVPYKRDEGSWYCRSALRKIKSSISNSWKSGANSSLWKKSNPFWKAPPYHSKSGM